MTPGDIVGHEPMGIVREVGVRGRRPCRSATASSSRSTSAAAPAGCARAGSTASARPPRTASSGTGASLLGYSKLYGQVPGGQAEYAARAVRRHAADQGAARAGRRPLPVPLRRAARPRGRPSSTPTSETGGTLLVLGAGPIGDMAARIALHRGLRVIVVDSVPERLGRVRAAAPRPSTCTEVDGVADGVRELTDGRGADAVIDAVGMEAHGSPVAEAAQKALALLPKKVQEKLMLRRRRRPARRAATRPSTRSAAAAPSASPASTAARPTRCRCSSCSTSRCRCGWARPTCAAGATTSSPLLEQDEDVLGVETFATHHLPLDEAPEAYRVLPRQGGGHGQGGVHALT